MLKLLYAVPLVLLTAGLIYLFSEVQVLKQKPQDYESSTDYIPQQATISPSTPQPTLPSLTPTPSTTPIPKSTPVVINTTVKQVTYIPLAPSFTTNSTEWTDVTGSDVYIRIGDYGKSPIVTWEATVKTNQGSGSVYVRLYDDTNKIAVNNSELSTTSANYVVVSSGNLNLWSGNNKYRVQIKSLNSQEASFSSGRIKIVY